MKKKVEHIFFDLDHTLWDYDRSSKETLEEIYQHFELSRDGVQQVAFIEAFYSINDQLWHKYNSGTIDREFIKTNRFKEIFKALGVPDDRSVEASNYFMATCSTKPYLMPDTLTALRYLEAKYELHIITNGFLDSQESKLSSSGISDFFKVMVTSECIDARKPAPEIFQYSLQKAGASASASVMIGDNPKTDIQGARNAGIGSVLYDPSGRKRSLADFSIQSHMELVGLF